MALGVRVYTDKVKCRDWRATVLEVRLKVRVVG
jgi:hypothetical protein